MKDFTSPWWDRQISFVNSARSTMPQTTTIIDAITIHSPGCNLSAFNDQELRQRKIDNVAILPHGEFKHGRRAQNLVASSGVVQLDFDHVASVEALKSVLALIPWICFASVSISGRGVWALSLTNCKHSEELAREITNEAALLTAHEVDEKNSISPAALRFLSCDPDPVWNNTPQIFPIK